MLLCICRGPRKGANYCTEETICRFTAKFALPGKQTKIPTTCTLCWYLGTFLSRLYTCWYLGIPFLGCTLCPYPGTFSSLLYTLLVSWYTFSWLYTLLVSWYLQFLVVHFVGILVPSGSWLYTLLVSWCLQVPGCTLCWYPGAFKFPVVHFVDILVPFPGCELGCKSTHCLFSTVAN